MRVEPFAVPVPPPSGPESSPPQAAADMTRAEPAITAAVLRRGVPPRRMLHLIAASSPSRGRVAAVRRTSQ
ncbi:hypothetical protein GCM10010466_00790 [Planomonospora alba]|uniref:Uncharacterized protein n=1 Tax=Planomonospora alba TaxID=161354 RepID=A0ABP6MJH4_9ACTN